MQSFVDTGTYVEVDDNGQDAVSTRWVYTYKTLPDGNQQPKARLVARGFEDRDIHQIETSSHTCAKANFRLALALSCTFGWTPHHIDIKTAFLQGKPLEREVYLRPPKEYYGGKPGKLWKMKKAVYGLGDAPKSWFESVTSQLKSTGAKWSPTDPAFLWWTHPDGTLRGLMCLHVDDIYWVGDKSFDKGVVQALRDKFPIGKESSWEFEYLGLLVKAELLEEKSEKKMTITVSQRH